MSKNQRVIPSTEQVERAIQIARIASTNDESRAWGALNDAYLLELPAKEDWTFLLATSSLTTDARYNTGTATVNTGATAVTFSSDVTLPTGVVGWRVKFTDNANVYDVTVRSNATACTIAPALSEDRNVSSGAYNLFNPYYALAGDFDRFPKNGGLQLWQGGKPTPVPEKPIQNHYNEQSASPGRPEYCRLVAPNTAGVARTELVPPPIKAYAMPYDYFYTPPPLRETTAGSCTVTASATSVAFQTGARISEMTTGMFFRVDAFGTGADSEWYRILAVSEANSTATLQTAFGVSGATSANYTVCSAPQFPLILQHALMWDTVKRLLGDQNDATFTYADSMQTAAINDAKRLYKSRVYSQPIETILEDYQYRR